MMLRKPLFLPGALFLALSANPALAQFEPVGYQLEAGSTLIDDCFCDRLPIEVPIQGTLVLKRLPVRIVGELYSVTELRFSSQDPAGGFDYSVEGSGTYYRGPELTQHSMQLEVTINGTAGIKLARDTTPAGSGWPAFDITVDESREPARDPFHIYSLRIVAAPDLDAVLYEAVVGDPGTGEGSFFTDDCTICERPTLQLPVAGSFLLRQTGGGGANPFTTYAVESLDLHATPEGFEYQITGGETYEWGGELALEQSMDLTVKVNDDEGVILSSGRVGFPEGVQFPEIDIGLSHQNPESELHVYSLQLVARPVKPVAPEFRRGDSNSDGTADISDAVHILLWRFSGGATPTCLDAADVDADAQHNLTDAIYLLGFLFQGGPEPPAPGPTACGPAKESFLGCESYPSCGV